MAQVYFWVGLIITWAAILAATGFLLYLLYPLAVRLYKWSALSYYIDYLKMKYTWARGKGDYKNVPEEYLQDYFQRIGQYLAMQQTKHMNGEMKHWCPRKIIDLYPSIFKHYPLVEKGYNEYFEQLTPTNK